MAEFRASRDGIERSIQRVIAGIVAFYLVTALVWVVDARESPGAQALLLIGCAFLGWVVQRGWRGLLGPADVAASLVPVVLALVANSSVDADGIGIQGGPAYVFMTTSALLAALVLPWRRSVPVGLAVAVVYVGGRAADAGADGFWTGLDEVMSDISTIAAAGVVLNFYRLSGKRADSAAHRRFVVQAAQATSTARDVVLAERRRVIHDDVIAALVTIRGARDADAGARAACNALEAVRSFGDTQGQPDASWVRDGELSIDVQVDVHRHEGSTERPAHVAAALAGAVREALRNADRHSGAPSVHAHVEMIGDDITVTIRDEGRGFDTTAPTGFGIRESILARVESVGGTVEIDSAPGRGTTVILRWSPGDRAVGPSARDSLATVRTEIGAVERFVLTVTGVAAIGQVHLMARHAGDSRWPVADVLLGLAVLAATAGVAWTASRRPLGPAAVAVVAVLWCTALVAGAVLAPDGALLTYDGWLLNMVCIVIFTLAVFVSFRSLMALALAISAVVAWWIATDPLVAAADAVDPFLQAPFYAAAIGAAATGFRRATAHATHLEAATALDAIEHAHAAARRTAVADLDLVVRHDLERFLTDIAEHRLDPTLEDVRDRSHVLAVQTRDELYLPGVLDADLHLLLATARTAGAKVRIHPSRVPPSTERTARLLRVALDPSNLQEATLTLPDGTDRRARLVLVPPLSADHAAHLVTELDDLDPHLEQLDNATIVVVDVGRSSDSSGRRSTRLTGVQD